MLSFLLDRAGLGFRGLWVPYAFAVLAWSLQALISPSPNNNNEDGDGGGGGDDDDGGDYDGGDGAHGGGHADYRFGVFSVSFLPNAGISSENHAVPSLPRQWHCGHLNPQRGLFRRQGLLLKLCDQKKKKKMLPIEYRVSTVELAEPKPGCSH